MKNIFAKTKNKFVKNFAITKKNVSLTYQNNQIKTKAMTTTETLYSPTLGEVTVLSNDGYMATVVTKDGEEKRMLVKFLSDKAPKAKVRKVEVDVKETFNGLVNQIKGDAQMRGRFFAYGDNIFNTIEKMAMQQGHFVSQIVESARQGKFITDKQAVAVAMFAKANGLV